MTSLIDVIFLLLLFFMLSSTFSRFAEIELAAGGAGSSASAPDNPVFLSLAADSLRLNGTEAALDALPEALAKLSQGDAPLTVLIALQDGVNAQRLTDLLASLRGISKLRVTVLESA